MRTGNLKFSSGPVPLKWSWFTEVLTPKVETLSSENAIGGIGNRDMAATTVTPMVSWRADAPKVVVRGT